MISAQQQALLNGSNCEVAFDALTCQLYATDASIYEIKPVAVAFPSNVRTASAVIEAAAEAGLTVVPRGAGTGLVGGALGEGVIIDFSRHNRQITDFQPERRSVRVGAGVVLDQLNAFLRPHGFRFGPDVATSSRATLGGMIASDSSGSHTPVYGTTADHVLELEVVLADGRVAMVGPGHDTLRKQRELIEDLVYFHSLEIGGRFPEGLLKRWPGYALGRALREPGNLNHLLCGSEGTLAGILSAELKIVPVPERRGLALIFFASIGEAMQATTEILDLAPAAIEHLDSLLLDQTKGQLEFKAARDLLQLDSAPCVSLLVVEFFEDVEERLHVLSKRKLGLRTQILRSTKEANLVWSLRKAGLSLLTGRKGAAKPTTGIEDTAVRPRDLPAYVAALKRLLDDVGLQASFYGHAGAGLLHVRPVLDLHSVEDRRRLRHVAEEVSELVLEFHGSLAGEHGVGIARTEFMSAQVGEGLMDAMSQIKASFDPHGIFNPGKIIPDDRFRIDTNLRLGLARELALPFSPVLAFAAKDESFTRNLEQCNGCGGCLKLEPTMCPTYIATREERMSTRGRANGIRAALQGYTGESEPLSSPILADLLESCLSCKACVAECPSNVNLALLKAELLHARARHDGLSLRQRMFSSVDFLGRVGCTVPRLANPVLNSSVTRALLLELVGITRERTLPRYATQRFDHWFHKHHPVHPGMRGRVYLWDDTFVRYHEPQIGMAAVKVLETAGFEVRLIEKRECCGRPAFSQGNLREAQRLGLHNLKLLRDQAGEDPILFLEPSCYSMFADDYLELKLPGAVDVARRCFLFEAFIDQLLVRDANAMTFRAKDTKVVIHTHCHAKALVDTGFMRRLAQRLPRGEITMLDTGCCGMAGAFGALESKYELSMKVAEPLAQTLRDLPVGTVVVASGASCRQQIEHLAPVRPRHMAELLASALV